MSSFQARAALIGLILALCASPSPVLADTASSTVVYDFPVGVWGAPNGAFPHGVVAGPYAPFNTSDTDLAGKWDAVVRDFDEWFDANHSYTFNRLDMYLGVIGAGLSGTYPLSAGTVDVRIYNADDSWNKGSLYAASQLEDASKVISVVDSTNCSGDGTTANPFSESCIFSFDFANPVVLQQGQHYIFELNANDVVSQVFFNGTAYYYPGFSAVGASVSQPPFGNDGIQHSPNPNTGAVYLRLVSATSTPACSVDCNSNVLFLPGIEGSRLYRPDYNGGTDKLWEPGSLGEDANQDERDLYLSSNGTSIRSDIYAREHDIIESTPTGDVYGPFIQRMDSLKSSGAITDWEPIAYDWRLSLDEILQNGHNIDGRIYYSGDNSGTTTPYIIQELKKLATSSKTKKVTIIAHSNGGLVTKRLTEILGSDASNLIDKIIFVAVPQAGTPQAIASGMHGYDQDFLGGFIISKATARTFASTSPTFYNLLPSASYFSYIDDPVVSFDSTLPDWSARYGQVIHSQILLDQFLTDTYGRIDSQDNSPIGSNQPIQMSASLISSSNNTHTSLDTWTPPSGVKLIQIAGWGVSKTPTGVTYSKKGNDVVPDLNTTIDGDGTVVVPSALWTSAATNVENYWINIAQYNKDHPVTASSIFSYNHGRILAIPNLINYLSNTITDSIQPLSNYVYLSSNSFSANGNRLRYSLHSPLTLNLYDDQGRHTGISTTTGLIEEQIPGTYYSELGDVKYLFVDDATSGHIVMNGYASGTFTFDVDQFTGDTPSSSVSYTDVPTTPATVVTTDVQQDLSSVAPLAIDQNGDGRTDVYAATDTGTLSLDQLLMNLTTAVNGLSIKDKQKTQLLNKIANIEIKIVKQKQKQSNGLTKLKIQIGTRASKGKIDAATAAALSATLDDLIAQETLIPLDTSIIQQLKDQINTANITLALKTSLQNKVSKLENLTAVNKSISSMTQAVAKKGAKGVIPDSDVQNLLNLLDQIQSIL